jgi:hypothetical protein
MCWRFSAALQVDVAFLCTGGGRGGQAVRFCFVSILTLGLMYAG